MSDALWMLIAVLLPAAVVLGLIADWVYGRTYDAVVWAWERLSAVWATWNRPARPSGRHGVADGRTSATAILEAYQCEHPGWVPTRVSWGT